MMNVCKVQSGVVALVIAIGALSASAQDVQDVYIRAHGFVGEARGSIRSGDPAGATPTRLDWETDLGANEEVNAGGLRLDIYTTDGWHVAVSQWSYAADGEEVLTADRQIGLTFVPAGTTLNTQMDLQAVAIEAMHRVDCPIQGLTIEAGFAIRGFTMKTGILPTGGTQERIDFNSFYYPTFQFEVTYTPFEMVSLHAEAAVGLPRYRNGGTEIMESPAEARGGIRFNFGSLTIEGGFQVMVFKFSENEGDADEDRTNLNLSGGYGEISFKF